MEAIASINPPRPKLIHRCRPLGR